ncbi:MAG: 3-phosphoshikimate 1-carboxyvinyltransferase [Anaerolineales bacterium]|nr:3-phosphoshikimate 1-carboxyvinyltransferase [Anaerolineales bacterium]
MKLTISPSPALKGTCQVPGDKSISHRAALFAAMANGTSKIGNFLHAGVTRVLLNSLKDLGVNWETEGEMLVIRGNGLGSFQPPANVMDCGNSATTMRFLIGAITAAGIPAKLGGSSGLLGRPMDRVIAPLNSMGATILPQEPGKPIHIVARGRGDSLHGIRYEMPIASAQVKSAILLAGLAADSPTEIIEPGPSRDHTERMLRSLGVNIISIDGINHSCILTPTPNLEIPPLKLTIPGDFSSAAFLIVAALIIPGSDIVIPGVGINPTRTGLLDVLIQMGAEIEIGNEKEQQGEPTADIYVKTSQLKGISIEGDVVVRMIDEFPILAVAGAAADGKTLVKDAEELRYKESDRITAIVQHFSNRGVNITEKTDGFEIIGGQKISGGIAEATRDHRLAMSQAVLGMIAESPLRLNGAEIIKESFPAFTDVLCQAGGLSSYDR